MATANGGRSKRRFQIFVSYRRGDSDPYARNIYDGLTQQFGHGSVFLDVDSIAPGRNFIEVLDETLRASDVFLVVIGPSWLNAASAGGTRRLDDPDDYVRLEIEAALARPDLLVIPVLVGGAQMPSADSLPESLIPFCYRNAMSLTDEHWRSTMGELVDALEPTSSEFAPGSDADALAAAGTATVGAGPRVRRSHLVLTAAIAVSVVVVAAVVVVASQGAGNNIPPPSRSTSSSTSVPPPRGTWSAPTNVDSNVLTGVSCVTARVCVAVDDKGYALSFDGTSWSPPSQIDTTTGVNAPSLTSLSCGRSTRVLCVAIDPYSSTAFAYSDNAWSPPTALNAVGVSCATDSFCMAGAEPTMHVYKDGRWSSAPDLPTAVGLDGLSCVSRAFCVAAGITYQPTAANSSGLSTMYDGARWSDLTTFKGPPGSYGLGGLSCTTGAFCVAIDRLGIAYVYNGKSWAAQQLPGLDPATGGDFITDVSCASETFCVTVGTGHAFTYDGRTWSPITTTGSVIGFTGVSCPSETFCVGVDTMGNAYTYKSRS